MRDGRPLVQGKQLTLTIMTCTRRSDNYFKSHFQVGYANELTQETWSLLCMK